MAPRTRALKTVDGAPSCDADKIAEDRSRLHSSGMLERGHHISVHTAPKIMRLRYKRRAPRFVPVDGRADAKVHRTQSLKTPAHVHVPGRDISPELSIISVLKAGRGPSEKRPAKEGCRCPPSAALPGTKIGTAVDGSARPRQPGFTPPTPVPASCGGPKVPQWLVCERLWATVLWGAIICGTVFFARLE